MPWQFCTHNDNQNEWSDELYSKVFLREVLEVKAVQLKAPWTKLCLQTTDGPPTDYHDPFKYDGSLAQVIIISYFTLIS